jgi:hypothetical protein
VGGGRVLHCECDVGQQTGSAVLFDLHVLALVSRKHKSPISSPRRAIPFKAIDGFRLGHYRLAAKGNGDAITDGWIVADG